MKNATPENRQPETIPRSKVCQWRREKVERERERESTVLFVSFLRVSSLSLSPLLLSFLFSLLFNSFFFFYFILLINHRHQQYLYNKKSKLSIVGVEEQWRVTRCECGRQRPRLADPFFNYFSWYSDIPCYWHFPFSTLFTHD